MAKRRGIIRRIVDAILNREPPKPTPKPTTSKSLKQAAIDNILAQIPLANRDTITQGVDYMDTDELRWTATATATMISNAARQNPDRLDTDTSPLNPWWYN